MKIRKALEDFVIITVGTVIVAIAVFITVIILRTEKSIRDKRAAKQA